MQNRNPTQREGVSSQLINPLHDSTFQYLSPTDEQIAVMADVRQHFTSFSAMLERNIPPGPDKTYLMRKLREVAMWANIAITRHADGSPRTE